MTERTLELSLLLPRAAECGGCVEEVGRELLRLDGIHDVEPDVSRGLLRVGFDEAALDGGDVETFARRAGAQAHCEDHCPLAVHEHGPLDLSRPLAAEDAGERRILHVTGMDCADCAVKLQGALRREQRRAQRRRQLRRGDAGRRHRPVPDGAARGLPRRAPAGLRHGRAARRGRRRRRTGGRGRARRARLLALRAARGRHPRVRRVHRRRLRRDGRRSGGGAVALRRRRGQRRRLRRPRRRVQPARDARST